MKLLVVLNVHEVIIVAVGVEEFHLHFVDGDSLDGIARAESVLEHGAGAKVTQFGLDEGAQVSRSAVFHAEHRVQLIVMLYDHAGTHLCGWNRHSCNSSFPGRTAGRKSSHHARLPRVGSPARKSAARGNQTLDFTRGPARLGSGSVSGCQFPDCRLIRVWPFLGRAGPSSRLSEMLVAPTGHEGPLSYADGGVREKSETA